VIMAIVYQAAKFTAEENIHLFFSQAHLFTQPV